MKRSKRLLAVLMVLSLCLTLIPMQVLATGDPQQPSKVNDQTDPPGEEGGAGGGDGSTGGTGGDDGNGGGDGGGNNNGGDGGNNNGGDNGGQTPATKYTVTLKYNDGSTKDKIETVDEGKSLTLPNPTRTNYTFEGWELDSSTVYKGGASVKVTGNMVLSGKWKPVATAETWTITFDYQKADKGDSTKKITVKDGEKVSDLPTPKKDGYSFGGWWTDKSGKGTQYVEGKTTVSKNVTLYAYWKTGSSYTVTFDYQKGTNRDNITSLEVKKDAKIGNDMPRTSRNGFELAGWMTKKDGYGQLYTKDTKITEDVKLYAFWVDEDYMKVTFNYEGGTDGDQVPYMGVKKNEIFRDYNDDLPEPKRDNYTFDGWYTEKNGEGDEFTRNTKVTKDIKVYANWKVKNGYTVKFDYQGATSGTSEKDRVISKDDKIGNLPTPTMTGYTFRGWFTDKNGLGDQYSSSTKITKNVTLYAHFTASDGQAVKPEGPFADVAKDDWFCKQVEFVTNKKLFSGMGDGRFEPQTEMTRGMFVTVLGRMAESMGFTTTGYSNTFSDVPDSEWYAQYVSWAAANNVVEGYSEWEFGPNDGVTREQMASLFVRFCKYANIQLGSGSDTSFADSGVISSWAREDVTAVVGAGLMQGDNGNFDPKGKATRAQVATVFMNLSDKYVK